MQAIPHFLFSPHDLKTFVGLYLGINPFRAPPGSMDLAENIIIRSQGVLEPRRGMRQSARPPIPINAFGYKVDEKKMLAAAYDSPALPPLLDVYLGHRTRFAVYDYQSNTWAQAAMLPGNLPFDRPVPGYPARFASAQNALYLQSKYGLLKMEDAGTPLSTLTMLSESSRLANSPWTGVGATASNFWAQSPDNSASAARVQANAGAGGHGIAHATTFVSGKNYGLSVYLKAGTVSFAYVGTGGGTFDYAVFDLSGGVVSVIGGNATAAMWPVPGATGWYRCIVCFPGSTASLAEIFMGRTAAEASVGWTAAGTENLYGFGAQLEEMGPYTPAPLIQTVDGTKKVEGPTLRPAMLVKPWTQPTGSAWAGNTPALDPVGSWLANGKQVAYRWTIARFGANNELIESEPSERVIVANNSAQAMGVTHTVDAHPMYPRDAFLRLWRSQQVPITEDPSDECFLVAESQLPALTPLGANGYIDTRTRRTTTLTDLTPDTALFVPLYTNPATGEGLGLLGANNTPPQARDMTTLKSRGYYCGTRDVHRILLQVIGTGSQGVTTGSSITIDGVTFSFALTDSAAMSPQVFTSGTVAQNLENTARALVAHINHYFAGRTGVFQGGISSAVYASYLAVSSVGAGQILLQRLVPGAEPIQVKTSSRNGWDRDYTMGRNSDDNWQVAGLSWTKIGQMEAAPIVNSAVVGDAAMDALRVIALREAVFLFKRDGLYKITDDGVSPTISLLDPTIKLIAPETAVSIDNVIIALTESGVVLVSEGSGAINISDDQIGRPLKALVLAAGQDAVARLSYGVAYQGQRQYILALPESPTATACTTYYVYNLQTQTWTTETLPLPTVAGMAHFDQNVLYFAAPFAVFDTFRGFMIERNAGTGDDYRDFTGSLRCPASTATDTLVFSGDLTKPVLGVPNFILDSQDRFSDTSVWIANATTGVDFVTAKGLAPDGSIYVSTLTDTFISGAHNHSQLAPLEPGQTYTISCHKKADSLGFCGLDVDFGAYYAVFNLSNGTVSSVSNATASVVALGNGWYRCSLTFGFSGVANPLAVYVRMSPGDTAAHATPGTSYAGTGGTLLIWGFQVERAAAASAYTRTPVCHPITVGTLIQQFQATKALEQTVTAVSYDSSTGLTTVKLDAAPASAWSTATPLSVLQCITSKWRMLPQHADHPLTAKVWREAYLSFRYLDLDRLVVDWQSEMFQYAADNPATEQIASPLLDAAPFRVLPFSDSSGPFGQYIWERQTRDVVLKATLHPEVVSSGQLILGVTMGQARRRFEVNGFDMVMNSKSERPVR